MNATPKTTGLEIIRCVWSGGGYAIWQMREAGVDLFRLSGSGQWIGDYATEREATDEMAARDSA